ncbi:MAG: hypothetical protein KBH93_04000 [Anaerolineae bacterium]|nr:hypothetical protein [Anaerolineae bacterium]
MTARLSLFLALLLVLLPGASALAQDDLPPSPLLAMLAGVPEGAIPADGGWATVRYTDYAALYESEGITKLRDFGNLDLLMTAVPLPAMLTRLAAGPEALSYVFPSAGQMAGTVGFEWLLDVDRSLEFGDPPGVGLLLGGEFDTEAIGAALQARDFSQADVSGVTVWHRFDDLAISAADRDTADPFGGHLGAAARIALLPDMLANARSWPLINGIIGAAQGNLPSLADDPAYRALAGAITAPDGLLIQALFFSGEALQAAGDPAQLGLAMPAADLGPLPPYALAVLADRQEGNDQVHLIGLVYADAPTAQAAADVLATRIADFRLSTRPDIVLAEEFGATVSASVIEREADGLAVALVEARYPLPAERSDAGGHFLSAGRLYSLWVQAIMRREFTPLWW